MNDNPLADIQPHDRISVRAVLVRDGEDPGPALSAAGTFDPIGLPVVLGEDPHAAGMLGDGRTPNLICVLETAGQDDLNAFHSNPPDRAASLADAPQQAEPFNTTAPAAFGMRSFAPIGRLGDARSGPYGSGATGFAPSPGRSLETDRRLTDIHLRDTVWSASSSRTV